MSTEDNQNKETKIVSKEEISNGKKSESTEQNKTIKQKATTQTIEEVVVPKEQNEINETKVNIKNTNTQSEDLIINDNVYMRESDININQYTKKNNTPTVEITAKGSGTKKSIKKVKNKKKNKLVGCLGLIIKLILTIILLGLIGGFLFILPILIDTPNVTPEDISLRIEESSLIVDSDGNIIDKLQGYEFRTIVPMDQISPWLKDAVIAIEDERFYEHNGIDIQRIVGAIIYDLQTKSLAQGASTINMQLAKNLYTSTDKSFTRKLKDMSLALKIDKTLSKEEILHTYLNTISLSRGNLGVEAASVAFFNKPASQLDLAESAIIAGITKNPSRYTPYKTVDITPEDDLSTLQIAYIPSSGVKYEPTDFEKEVYSNLLKLGIIDVYQYDQLKNGHIYAKKAVLNPEAKERQELVLAMMLKNRMIDKATYEAAKAQPVVINLGKRNKINISSYFTDALKVQLQQALESDGYTPDEATDLMINGGLRIYATLDHKMQNIVEREIENPKNYHRAFTDENGIIQPQAAIVIIEQETGFVKAMAGGRGIGGSKIYNRALNPRQPGSSIKPIAVYMPALENGYTAAATVKDGPRPALEHESGYWPKNSTGYKGISTMSPMIWNSSNVSAVEFLNAIGIQTAIESLKKQGISTIVTSQDNFAVNDENLSLALGGMTKGVTPLEITSAFATIANQGEKITPYYFSKVEDRNGKIILEAPKSGEKIFSEGNCYVMTELLRKVVTTGTGRATQIPNMPVAGKTGTTTDEKDIWFVGYTPYYTAGVWVGTDMPTQLYDYAKMSNTLWKNIMQDVHKDLKRKEFTKPDSVRAVTICQFSGELPRENCPRVTDYFVKGTEPSSLCISHSGANALGAKNIAKNQDKEEELTKEEIEKQVDDLIVDDKTTPENNKDTINIPGIGDIIVPDNGRVTIPNLPTQTPPEENLGDLLG